MSFNFQRYITDNPLLKESVGESYFQNDMTVVSDPNAYTADDFAKAAEELQSNRFDVEYDQEGIVVHDKKTKSNISFDYTDNSWTATFEDGMIPSTDSVKMNLDEFIEEVQSWKAWSNQNRI